jgi:Putative metallopeptidase domain
VRGADAEINDDLVPAGLDLPGSPVMPADLAADNGLLAEQWYAAVPGHDPFRISNESAGWPDRCSDAPDAPDWARAVRVPAG